MAFEHPKIVIVGAGAMGSLFGGLLAEGGADVTLVDVWREHVDAINRDGLQDRRPRRRARDPPRGDARSAGHSCGRRRPVPVQGLRQRGRRPLGAAPRHRRDRRHLVPERPRQRGNPRPDPRRGARPRRADGAGGGDGRGRRRAQLRRPAELHRRAGRRAVRALRSRSPTRSPATACRRPPAPTSRRRSGRSSSATPRSARPPRRPT